MIFEKVLQIDPQFALSWVSPTRLRLGFDSRLLEFDDPAAELQSIISSLISGATLPQLKRRAHRVGLPESELHELLKFIEPALLRLHSPRPRRTQVHTSSLQGSTKQALPISLAFDFQAPPSLSYSRSVTDAFRFFNFAVNPDQDSETPETPLVFISRFFPSFGFLNREVFGERLAVPVIFSDGGVRIGPYLGRPAGCCVDCLAAFETCSDPDWPALVAAQLGTAAPSETEQVFRQIPPLVQLVITQAESLAANFSRDRPSSAGQFTQWFLPVKDGRVIAEASRRQVTVRPSCPCTALDTHYERENGRAHAVTTTPEYDAA